MNGLCKIVFKQKPYIPIIEQGYIKAEILSLIKDTLMFLNVFYTYTYISLKVSKCYGNCFLLMLN